MRKNRLGVDDMMSGKSTRSRRPRVGKKSFEHGFKCGHLLGLANRDIHVAHHRKPAVWRPSGTNLKMGSSSDFFEIFAAEPGTAAGISFARYMELAMFHPTAGYYTRNFKRVGRDDKADFSTATSFSPVFGELVVAAAVKLLGATRPGDLDFVEIGAEPNGGILRGIAHPF